MRFDKNGENWPVNKVTHLITETIHSHKVTNEMGVAAMLRILATSAITHPEPNDCIEAFITLLRADFEQAMKDGFL